LALAIGSAATDNRTISLGLLIAAGALVAFTLRGLARGTH